MGLLASADGEAPFAPERRSREWERGLPSEVGRISHAVQVYEHQDFLRDVLCEFVAAALLAGNPVLLITSEARYTALRDKLAASALDLEAAIAEQRLRFLDAASVSALLLVEGELSSERFFSCVATTVRELRAASGERKLHVYGDAVDLLWRAGNQRAALRLEELWTDLAGEEALSLLCGYSVENFSAPADCVAFQHVCDAHNEVFPSEQFSATEPESATLRKVALLEQRARLLETEIRHREALERDLIAREEAARAERKKLEAIAQELEIANRAKDDFVATVSHELRTPLNAILGWVCMLRAGQLPEDKRERALETIERNANAQSQLIEDLLDVSRIASGKLRLEIGSVDLRVVIEQAVEAVRPAAARKGVVLQEDSATEVGFISGDAGRLQQIVWNLLTNAVKFTPAGGFVRIAAAQRPSSIEISVSDSGQGIEPEFLPKVFERFRQADATPGRKHGGLGLGLAIVRHLVELHGGAVSAASDGPGRGATFKVTLPVAPARATPTERPPAIQSMRQVQFSAPTSVDLRGARILVVDDELDARELLLEVLTERNAEVVTAASVAEALQLVDAVHPDVIVSDIGMPEEDGYSLIRQLRERPASRGGRTPAVALTAYARFEDRTKALVAGFNMHVPKPVEPAELLACLASLTSMFARQQPE